MSHRGASADMPKLEAAGRLFALAGATIFERGWLSSNNVLFVAPGADQGVLVDSGYWTHQDQTVSLVRNALGERTLSSVLNTHLHSDHCGGNAALVRAFGSKVIVPAGEREKVQAWDESLLTYRDTGQGCPRFSCDAVVANGARVRLGPLEWEAIAAPGHDPESIVLYQADLRLLVSADALWQNGFGVVFPEIEGESAFGDVRDTLDLLSQRRIDWVIPGHGPPFDEVPAALARARARLATFLADPTRHAAHAAKVLVKFHLLEVQSQPLDELLEWMAGVRYLQLLHRVHFGPRGRHEWMRGIVESLCDSSAAIVQGERVFNN